jgi:hypothetical protein
MGSGVYSLDEGLALAEGLVGGERVKRRRGIESMPL